MARDRHSLSRPPRLIRRSRWLALPSPNGVPLDPLGMPPAAKSSRPVRVSAALYLSSQCSGGQSRFAETKEEPRSAQLSSVIIRRRLIRAHAILPVQASLDGPTFDVGSRDHRHENERSWNIVPRAGRTGHATALENRSCLSRRNWRNPRYSIWLAKRDESQEVYPSPASKRKPAVAG